MTDNSLQIADNNFHDTQLMKYHIKTKPTRRFGGLVFLYFDICVLFRIII